MQTREKAASARRSSVLFVDPDRNHVDAVRRHIGASGVFEPGDRVEDLDLLQEYVEREGPRFVLLDPDIDRRRAFQVVKDIYLGSNETRVVISSRHVRKPLLGVALDAGAWGYIWKQEALDAVLPCLLQIQRDEFALSPFARKVATR